MTIRGRDLFDVYEALNRNTNNVFDTLTKGGGYFNFLEEFEDKLTPQEHLADALDSNTFNAPLIEYTNVSGNTYGAHVIGVIGRDIKIIDLEYNEVDTISFEDISNIEHRIEIVSMMEAFI